VFTKTHPDKQSSPVSQTCGLAMRYLVPARREGSNAVTKDRIVAKGDMNVFAGFADSAAGFKKGSGTICRNGPKGAAHKWCLTPFF
jgi:hypothetical protein